MSTKSQHHVHEKLYGGRDGQRVGRSEPETTTVSTGRNGAVLIPGGPETGGTNRVDELVDPPDLRPTPVFSPEQITT